MGKSPKILITDRNRHVRDLLQRELAAAGYRAQVAKDGLEVLDCLNGDQPPNLLILDPEVPFLKESGVLERLQERDPPLPVVVHSFPQDYVGHVIEVHVITKTITFVEKSGNTDLLKAVVADILCTKCFVYTELKNKKEG